MTIFDLLPIAQDARKEGRAADYEAVMGEVREIDPEWFKTMCAEASRRHHRKVSVASELQVQSQCTTVLDIPGGTGNGDRP